MVYWLVFRSLAPPGSHCWGFQRVEVGRVAGADLGGLSIGAVVTAMLIGKVNRRLLVLIGLSLAVVANGLCISVVDYDQVLWLRF